MIERLAEYWASRKPKKSKIWKLASSLLTIAMVFYLIYAFLWGGMRLSQIDWRLYSRAVLQSLVIYLLSVIVQFYAWANILSFHRSISWEDVNIYARTILMRSLPGGAWHWVGRISMYSSETQALPRVIILGNFLEWALLTLSGAGIFFFFLPSTGLKVALAVPTLAAALLLATKWQPTSQRWSLRLLKGGLLLILYGLAWLLGAFILFLMVSAVTGIQAIGGWEAVKIWTLTGSLGMLITMLPSSLGIREISLVWMLQPGLSASVALLIALMLRIIYTLADAIWGMVGWLISALILQKRPVQK